jgi:hypothetical protein
MIDLAPQLLGRLLPLNRQIHSAQTGERECVSPGRDYQKIERLADAADLVDGKSFRLMDFCLP